MMAEALPDGHESYAACQQRLLAYERERYARSESSSVEELERRVERTLTDDRYVNGERQHWVYR